MKKVFEKYERIIHGIFDPVLVNNLERFMFGEICSLGDITPSMTNERDPNGPVSAW